MTREEMLAVAKPILFNTEMVRAILDNHKTVTRRLVKPQPNNGQRIEYNEARGDWVYASGFSCVDRICKPSYRPGEILYVRETWRVLSTWEGSYTGCEIEYKAGGSQMFDDIIALTTKGKWRPSIHMPKKAARIFLRVTDVRVERLQEITEDDVLAEGAEPLISCPNEHGVIEPDGTLGDMCWNTDCCGNCMYIEKTYGELFGEIVWNTTIKPADRSIYGWNANPWVWVIKFEKLEEEK